VGGVDNSLPLYSTRKTFINL